MEELKDKHRLERKELQSTITGLKKSVPKNDKKKKKEVFDIISKLETEMSERHESELLAIESEKIEEQEPTVVEEVSEPVKNVKSTRAQKRRNKKEVEDRERNKRISEQEVLNRSGPRATELLSIGKTLKELGLEIYNIPADGNCLYCSIQHQLEVKGHEILDVNVLRKQTANFMRENKEDFLPFMYNDSGESNVEHLEKYCKDVETTKLWGGQLELRALSNILKCPIKVIQANAPVTVQGEQFNSEPLVLTYHRYLYRLGEHYNSTVTAAKINEDLN